MANTIREALLTATSGLTASDSPQLDAELLLAHSLQKTREYLRTHPEALLEPAVEAGFRSLIDRRQAGEPVAYLLGYREFWDISVEVNRDVLIPRPETELLVETVLELPGSDSSMSVLDLGTGSGVIALALAKSRSQWQVLGVDISEGAVDVASRNAKALALKNVGFTRGDWCAHLNSNSFDIVVSNPPYVAGDDVHLQQGDLRFEPQIALVSDEDGYADLFWIIDAAADVLKDGGWLLLEHGYEQHVRLAEKLVSAGYKDVEVKKDLAGHERVTLARWMGEMNLPGDTLGSA